MKMSNLIKTAEKEILRKEILELCYKAAPAGCSIDVLAAAFAHSGSADKAEIQCQVDYLQMKNLVTVTKVGNERLGLSSEVVSLTGEGIDYLEGNTERCSGIYEG